MLADRRLRTNLPTIWNGLDAACRRLGDLSRSAIRLTRRLVWIGFRILAHSDLDRIGSDTLWNVARGLEQFNSIASTPFRHELCLRGKGASWRGSFQHSGQHECSVTLMSVFKLIANERAKYAAASTVEHFPGNPEFLRLILGRGPRVPPPSWMQIVLSPDSDSRRSFTAVPDCLNVPDVAGQPSPLVDFNRRETTFVNRFLCVVCHSTNLIRPSSAADVHPDAESKGRGDAEVSSQRNDGARRRNVSWGDASLSVAVQATARRYMGDIWRAFARHLVNFLVNLEWKATRKESRGRLGSVVVCPHSATLVLECMIRHAVSEASQSGLISLCRSRLQRCTFSKINK